MASHKMVPQPQVTPSKFKACKGFEISNLRNYFCYNPLICLSFGVDCKSTYAGSIPTSASTLKAPQINDLRGFFLPAIRNPFRNF